MWLITVYVGLMLVGDLLDFGLGAAVAQILPEPASLAVFIASYFLTLWFAWVAAVWLTEPRAVVK
jgi:hypothetical protein